MVTGIGTGGGLVTYTAASTIAALTTTTVAVGLPILLILGAGASIIALACWGGWHLFKKGK